MIIRKIDLDENIGYNDDSQNTEQLQNSEAGIGKDKDDGKLYLVTSCCNCGDYHYLQVNEVLEFLKERGKAI